MVLITNMENLSLSLVGRGLGEGYIIQTKQNTLDLLFAQNKQTNNLSWITFTVISNTEPCVLISSFCVSGAGIGYEEMFDMKDNGSYKF